MLISAHVKCYQYFFRPHDHMDIEIEDMCIIQFGKVSFLQHNLKRAYSKNRIRSLAVFAVRITWGKLQMPERVDEINRHYQKITALTPVTHCGFYSVRYHYMELKA